MRRMLWQPYVMRILYLHNNKTQGAKMRKYDYKEVENNERRKKRKKEGLNG